MANGIVRLERFFSSRRKPSSTPSTEPSSPVTPSEPQFPSPSFIRPKASRMTARKETSLKQSCRSDLALDFADSHLSPLKSASSTYKLRQTTETTPTLVRSASFDDGHCDSLFQSYQFPNPPKEHPDQLPLLERVDLESIFDGFTSDSSDSSAASTYQKPTSTPDDPIPPLADRAVDIERLVESLNKKLPEVPSLDPSSEDDADTLGPVADWDLADPVAVDIINTDLFEDIERHLGEAIPKQPLLHSASEPTLAQASRRSSLSSSPSSTLWEPDFTDFMTLSDEDIAESDMAPSGMRSEPDGKMPPTPPLTASTTDTFPSSRPRSLLTLSPPYASKPAAAAAYEAARIALRYDFDLVYVVNLWPDSTRPRTPSIGEQFQPRASTSSHHMTGRLLAAYGLEHVKSPFQITSSVHTKILRSEGWIEYRSQEACKDEFARGYACSFFTGSYSRSNSIDSNMSVATQSSRKRIDRGLVFAAYRKPSEDGSMRCSDEKELKSIKRDAEGLVEMLIDIHAAHRLRQAPLFTQQEEIGPIPAQDFQVA